jgi:serine/threonine-protein kinase
VLAGRYALIEQVGEGAMGVVWRAHDRNLERDVAIKLLHSFVAGEPEQRLRFAREARTLAALANEHIVRVYDYVDVGEQSFLVMEFIEGGNLAAELFARLPLPLAEAAVYLAPVAEGLGYAHGQGVVHRDLTPTNILIERASGRVLTTDFGLARAMRSAGSLTSPGVLIGTPEYWSPEQALGCETTPSADVFALGCIAFLLVTGGLPFTGEDRLAVGLRRAHARAPSLRASLPGAPQSAIALVDSLLAREPSRRPAASVAATALRELAGSKRASVAASGRAAEAVSPPTLVLPAEKPTLAVLPLVVEQEPEVPAASSAPAGPAGGRSKWTRLAVVSLVAAAATFGALFLAALDRPALRVPHVVALGEVAARAKLRRLLPGARLIVKHSYSTHVARGRVISQRPRAKARVARGAAVRLVVSDGTPFAAVPSVGVGLTPSAARATLARSGFGARYRRQPSWTVRKGTVIELQPTPGTRVRRPARVTIVVASGYPRSVVPDLLQTDFVAAESRLQSEHLRFRVVYRLEPRSLANQVLDQQPTAGTSVYQGTRIQLTVARTPQWVKVFAVSGTRGYLSAAFTVPQRWRIRYRLSTGYLGFGLAEVSWAPTGGLFGGNGFTAHDNGSLRTYIVPDPGTYQLTVSPYFGTGWYVEVDAFK